MIDPKHLFFLKWRKKDMMEITHDCQQSMHRNSEHTYQIFSYIFHIWKTSYHTFIRTESSMIIPNFFIPFLKIVWQVFFNKPKNDFFFLKFLSCVCSWTQVTKTLAYSKHQRLNGLAFKMLKKRPELSQRRLSQTL